MKVVSVINYKGGVGKTTITANLAAEMAYRGKRVLAIDLDPQSNLTFSYISVDEWEENYEKNQTIKSWLESIIVDEAPPSFKDLIIERQRVHLICSHLGLIDADLELSAKLNSAPFTRKEQSFVKTFSYLKNELFKLRRDYDVVLFDCPPNFSMVTRNALVACDYYIVPAKMDYLSTLGITQLQRHIQELVSNYNKCVSDKTQEIHPIFLGAIATMISLRNESPISTHQKYIYELKRQGIEIFDTMIRENKTIYADAPEKGIPVVLMNGGSNNTYRQVIKELKHLTTEFINKAGI